MSAVNTTKLKIAFIHPDLGIGGAERLVVDAALGLQRLGHSVDIYTSHHDSSHCFEETRDGTLRVHNVTPPFPRSLKGKLHILFAHLRQLHLTLHLLRAAPSHDVYFVDQLSTCIPFLRFFAHKRVVFYCHFPDKLLSEGELLFDGTIKRRRAKLLKRMYRYPMDWLEETTTGCADAILANSNFTTRVFKAHFGIQVTPRVVYPGINFKAYEQAKGGEEDEDVRSVISNRPTLLSLNRFEKKKNAALALKAFGILKKDPAFNVGSLKNMRIVLAGGYDPRLQDNVSTLLELIALAETESLSFATLFPKTSGSLPSLPSSTSSSPQSADVVFLLNFTTLQRSALLNSPSTIALLYTPANEHFGIGPVEGMICGLPVLACNSGGPTESVVSEANPTVGNSSGRTGWLVEPNEAEWAEAVKEICAMSHEERGTLAERARRRAREKFGMEAMAEGLQEALYDAVQMGDVPDFVMPYILTFGAVFIAAIATLLWYLVSVFTLVD